MKASDFRMCARTVRTRFSQALCSLRVRIASFHRDEGGGAYTLSYVMTIPFVMLLISLIIESTLMMTAKVGTVYSAFAAARTVSVWSSAADWPDVLDKAEQAAKQAMLPFASGSSPGDVGADNADGEAYWDAYNTWATAGVAQGYIAAKAKSSNSRLSILIADKPAKWDADIQVSVTYDYPIHIPGLGQILGQRSAAGGYVFSVTSRATLPNDGPQNASQTLGIGYGNL